MSKNTQLNFRTKRAAFIVVDRFGIPLVGTKVCATARGAKNSMAPWLNGFVHDRIGWQGSLSEIDQKAQTSFGIPKPVHPDRIDDFVDEMRSVSNHTHPHGNKKITRELVEEYNEIIEEIVDEWSVKKLEG